MKEKDKIIRVKIKEQSLWARLAAYQLKGDAAAIVFGRTIYLWNISKDEFLQNKRLVLHELEHVRQYQRLGFLPFIIFYLWESLRNGYYQNRFEVEARRSEATKNEMDDIRFI